ncbi:ABC transporter permease [Oceanobacillus sp. CAU 1775]
MTFRQFAFNNVIRNKRIYAAYFLSSLFSVLVFFVYAIFAFHPGLTEVHPSVSIGLHFAEGIIYVFSFIFVLISMSAFLHSRKKEFGLMVMLGMTNKQLRRMVFLENVLIGTIATISGVAIGLIFAKLILMTAESVLQLREPLPFYVPWEAILLTSGAFILLFIVISFFTVRILKGNKLIDLIKGSAVPKKEPKASILLSVLAVFLLALGYGIALTVEGDQVITAMVPVTIIVTIGTYFLFTQLNVFIIRQLKKRKSIFWKKTNLILFSDLANRMKDNARTFFFVAIVSTVAFTAIGALVGFRVVFTDDMLKTNHYAMEYSAIDGNEQVDEHLDIIESELQGFNYQTESLPIKKISIPSMVRGYVTLTGVIPESAFNALVDLAAKTEHKVDVSGNDAVHIFYKSAAMGYEESEVEQERVLDIENSEHKLNQKAAFGTSLIGTYDDYLIVDDAFYNQLTANELESYHVFQVEDWKSTIDAGERILEKLEVKDTNGFGSTFKFSSLGYEWTIINQSFGAVLFIGLFMGIVFFVAAGSFLYFRLYADLGDEQKKFSMINKIGLTTKELSRILTIQLALLFFVPIVIAIIHGAVALTALESMLEYSLIKSTFFVLGSFSVIQVIYFIFIRQNYIKKVKNYIEK